MIDYRPQIQPVALHPAVHVDVLRLDLLHPQISGNKWFKLKRNLEEVRRLGKTGLLTFGGAFSNHIAASAAAGRLLGIPTVGIIRGDELMNTTLAAARSNGMQLQWMNRSRYAEKESEPVLQQLRQQFGDMLVVPEGGNNEAGWLGSAEIIDPAWEYDYIFCACGTAATYTGLLLSTRSSTRLIGISVLKGANRLPAQVMANLRSMARLPDRAVSGNEALNNDLLSTHAIMDTYAFGGYACFDKRLISFKRNFEIQFGIPLDHIYTVKLFYALHDLVVQDRLFPGARVLAIHSGGLQGNAGFEARYGAG